jgi:hypothetical protein
VKVSQQKPQNGSTGKHRRYRSSLSRRSATPWNWQSEFLQSVWQISGLALLYHIGSPQSKDGNGRLEEKSTCLQAVSKDGDDAIAKRDRAYHRD